MNQFILLILNGIADGAIYAAVALAIVIIWRSTRVLNFAQGAMAVAACYIALRVVESTGSIWLGMVVGILAGALIGVAIERMVIRFVRPEDHLPAVIATLGMLTIIHAVLGIAFGNEVTAFPAAFSQASSTIGDLDILSPQRLFVVAAVVVMMVLLQVLFTRTSVGLRMRASAFSPTVSRLLGVRVSRMLTLGWALAGGVGALAGILVLPSGVGISPNALDYILILGFAAAVLGGLDSTTGAVVGGLVLGVLLSFARGYLGSETPPIVTLALLLVVLLVKPGGLFANTQLRKV